MSQHVLSRYMFKLLHLVYKGDPEPERTLRVLRRFQLTGHFLGSPPPFFLVDLPELEEIVKDKAEAEVVMSDNDIIGIANDRERNIRYYVIFDPNAINIVIIRP